MRIKDVVKLTGLTEKTIRFYEEKLLITPEKEIINGREFRSYSDRDIEALNLTANLRKLDFSVADILKMRSQPESIPEVFREYCVKITNEVNSKKGIIEKLEQIDFTSVAEIEDLAVKLKGMTEGRPLPKADIEFDFHKLDGLTREELHQEVLDYQEREYKRSRVKIRNTKIIFVLSQIIFAAFSVLTIYTLNFLGYIQAYYDNTAWVKLLIPVFALLISGAIYVFVKVIRRIAQIKEENLFYYAIKICRNAIVIIVIILLIGTAVQLQELKSMKDLRDRTGDDIAAEWNTIEKMTHYVEQYLTYEKDELGESGLHYSLYVNQTCYHYAYHGCGDTLHTKMYDLLISCYDPAFKELVYEDGYSDKAETASMLKELNSELNKISIEILRKSTEEKADLARYDNPAAVDMRARINKLVDKYCVGNWR